MIAILHNIRSLHNVGSIFRTADGAGVEKLYLTGITPSPLDRLGKVRGDVAKTALGAEKSVAWEKRVSISALIKKLRKEGYQVVALEQDKHSTPYYSLSSNYYSLERLALIVGAEVEGLPKTVLSQCNTIIEIPMHGKKESLNVAVAFGIAAFQLIGEAPNSKTPRTK